VRSRKDIEREAPYLDIQARRFPWSALDLAMASVADKAARMTDAEFMRVTKRVPATASNEQGHALRR
jgi:hypothetical protein